MQLKKCTKCNEWKNIEMFSKEKRTKVGLQSRCKKCIAKYSKIHWYKNHEKNLIRKKIYRIKNKDRLQAKASERYYNNLKENRLRGNKAARKTYQKYKEKYKEKARIYSKNNRDKILIRERLWAKNNPEKYKAKNRRHSLKRKVLIKTNGRVRLSTRMSDMIRRRLKARFGGKNQKHRKDYLPYTIDELMQHLEKQFTEGMTWDNYGKWHLDHRIPDSSFEYNSTKDTGFKESWALSNLQPLWAIDNKKKGSKLNY